MFGFKVKRDAQESHRWLALSGVTQRLLEYYANPDEHPLSSLRILDEISIYYATKSDPVEAWAWQHLLAQCPAHSLLNIENNHYGTDDRPYLEYDWSAEELVTRRAYEILGMFAELEPALLAQNMTPEFRARLLGRRPHSTAFSAPADYYLSATQFMLDSRDQVKPYLIADSGGDPVAPLDKAEALAYFALMLKIADPIGAAKSSEEAAIIFKQACEASRGLVVEGIEAMWLGDRLLPSLSQPKVVERMVSRLRLSATLD
jgi:hypothetical protein